MNGTSWNGTSTFCEKKSQHGPIFRQISSQASCTSTILVPGASPESAGGCAKSKWPVVDSDLWKMCIYIYVSANFYSSTHVSPTFLWHGNVLKGHHQNQVKHGEARTGWDAAPLAAKASWCARESWKIPVRNLAQETSMFFGKQNSVPCFRKGVQFHLVHTPIQPIQHQ